MYNHLDRKQNLKLIVAFLRSAQTGNPAALSSVSVHGTNGMTTFDIYTLTVYTQHR
jgi:hypothetical protein